MFGGRVFVFIFDNGVWYKLAIWLQLFVGLFVDAWTLLRLYFCARCRGFSISCLGRVMTNNGTVGRRGLV